MSLDHVHFQFQLKIGSNVISKEKPTKTGECYTDFKCLYDSIPDFQIRKVKLVQTTDESFSLDIHLKSSYVITSGQTNFSSTKTQTLKCL